MKPKTKIVTTDPELVLMERLRRGVNARRVRHEWQMKARAVWWAAKRFGFSDELIALIKKEGRAH